MLDDFSFPLHFMDAHKRLSSLADNKCPRSVSIKSVREFQKRCFRALRTQPLDKTEINARTSVRGQSGRLVDNEQIAVLKKHRQLFGGNGWCLSL